MEHLSVMRVFLWPMFLFGHFLEFYACTKQTTVNESNVSRVTRESFVTTQFPRMFSCVLIVMNIYIELLQEQVDKFCCNIYQLT